MAARIEVLSLLRPLRPTAGSVTSVGATSVGAASVAAASVAAVTSGTVTSGTVATGTVATNTVATNTVAGDTPATVDGIAGYIRPPDEQVTIYFREHSCAVYRYLVGVYGREEDAEEVTQEAFLRLHQALAARVVIDSPRAWTLTVARRLMLDRLRHENTHAARTVTVGTEVAETVRDSSPSPEDTLVERRRRAALHSAVRGLTDLERQCLFARAEGLTLREIGEVVNMDLRRVAEVVARSVRTLQGRIRA